MRSRWQGAAKGSCVSRMAASWPTTLRQARRDGGGVNTIALAFRLARRELRLRLTGFRIFFACLVLGVTAIAGVGSLSAAFLTGLAEQGRTLLGGDVVVHLVHREASAAERAWMSRRGRVSKTVSMRAMAYALK